MMAARMRAANKNTKGTRKKMFQSIESENIHLMDWLEHAIDEQQPTKHVIQYLIEKRLDFLAKNEISHMKKEFITESVKRAVNAVLSEADKLTADELKKVYLHSENFQSCGLLDSLQDDRRAPAEWYKEVLFHSATDAFLHVVTDEDYLEDRAIAEADSNGTPVPKRASPLRKTLTRTVTTLLSFVYPVVFPVIIVLQLLEYATLGKVKTIKTMRFKLEMQFSSANVLFFMQWCTNFWMLVLFILYIISYFGAGLNNYDDCFCEKFDNLPGANVLEEKDARDVLPANYYCNQYLYDGLRWLACRDPLDVTQADPNAREDVCEGDWGNGSPYPHILLSNDQTFSRSGWDNGTKEERMKMLLNEGDLSDLLGKFKDGHYGECHYFQEGLNVYKSFAQQTGMSDAEYYFRAYNWMMKPVDTNHWLIWSDDANVGIRVVLFIIVLGKLLNEITQFFETGGQMSKHVIDRLNMIDIVQVFSSLGYLVCETYRHNTRIDDFASSSFQTYETAARTLEVFALLSTIIIVMAICPKFNVYTKEVNSVVDMLILGLRYLGILSLFIIGLWFIAQNLYRRAIENNRDLAVINGDFESEKQLTVDLQFNEVDSFARVIRTPFLGIDRDETFFYHEDWRRSEEFEHRSLLPISIYWLFFTILIVIIGFNGLVAFMSANLSFGDHEQDLNEYMMPQNIIRYYLSQLQPKSAYWPVPFNVFHMVVETVTRSKQQYIRLCDSVDHYPGDDGRDTDLKKILIDLVISIVNEAEDDGMDFESTTGTSLQTLVDQMKDKDLTELASELRSEQPSKEVSQHDKLEKEEEEAATIYKNRKSSLSENDDAQNTVKTKIN